MNDLDAYAASCLSGKNLEAFLASTGPERDELRARALSQWMSPEDLATKVVAWAGIKGYVLEPSCGTGSLARAACAVGADVTTIDIDPQFQPDIVGDYLKLEFTGRFDYVLMNSPFENSMDCAFLERALAYGADDVVAILRLAALSGEERYQKVWRHVTLCGLVVLRTRPQFPLINEPKGPPRSDFCVAHLTLRDNPVIKPTQWW